MSLHLPSRRLLRSATALSSSRNALSFLTPNVQTRTISWWNKRGDSKDKAPRAPNISNPLTEEYLTKKPKQKAPTRGDLDESSIFEDETIAGPKPTKAEKDGAALAPRSKEGMEAALNPDPRATQRWHRKTVIKEIHQRGRLSRTLQLKRSERALCSPSHAFRTSVKKLMPLARQIAGKTVDEAIIQMRFSKKKVAKDVKEHLQHARNEAIVRRGMGLGTKEGTFTPVKIQTRHGKRVTVTDPTTLYIDEAWVGKNVFNWAPDYRARGNVNMMMNPSTTISVVIKEEKTRLRLHEERLKKEAKKKVWVQLPNRPITAQRQYYSW